MAVTLQNLKNFHGSKKNRKRVGRGLGSGHGAFSTRGTKGQRARSGGSHGLKRLGLSQLIRRTPKFKGQKLRYPKMVVVNIDELNRIFPDNAIVNSRVLISKNLIKTDASGLKILGQGQISKKLTVIADAFSESAKAAIIKAGGKAIVK